MNKSRFNLTDPLSALNLRRTGYASNRLPPRLRGIAQVRIGLGERFAFHGSIIAHRDLIAPTTRKAAQRDGLTEMPALGNADDIHDQGIGTEQDAVQNIQRYRRTPAGEALARQIGEPRV